MIRRTCTGKAKRLATHEVLETLMENRISAAVGGRVASISPAGTTSEITEHAEGNDDQVLKGCAYQEDFFYNRAANGLRNLNLGLGEMDVLWDVYPSLCADKEDCFFQVGHHRGHILLNLF